MVYLTTTEKLLPRWVFKQFGAPKIAEIMMAMQAHVKTFTDDDLSAYR